MTRLCGLLWLCLSLSVPAAEEAVTAGEAVTEKVKATAPDTGAEKVKNSTVEPASTMPITSDSAGVAELAPSEPEEESLRAIPLYEEYELLEWINANRHLDRVRDQDNCQLVQDIEARAEVLRLPAYQFLWGDMLAWGVCVPQQSRRGVSMMWKAADQGLPAALEQLGRYYYQGILVQQNRERAAPLMQEAAGLGLEKAQFTWARWLLNGSGSPLDYPQAYLWLKEVVITDKKQHQEVDRLSAALAAKMPPSKVKELNSRLLF